MKLYMDANLEVLIGYYLTSVYIIKIEFYVFLIMKKTYNQKNFGYYF